jgi:DNA-binding ferritin-like protein
MSYIEKLSKIKDKKASKLPELVVELLDASNKFHILHLIVKGNSSYAQHKALNELYDQLPDLADQVAESFQGATGEIATYKFVYAPELNSVEQALVYIKKLTEKIHEVQETIEYSEIVNDLDTIKTALNSAYYKLKFLG